MEWCLERPVSILNLSTILRPSVVQILTPLAHISYNFFSSPEWQFISESQKEELGLNFDADGEFWISFKDFQQHFNRLEICNLNPDSLSADELTEGRNKKWEMSVFEGEWVRGVTAGGCRNFIDTFSHNPQYRVTLEEEDEGDNDGKCTLIVALMQKNRRLLRKAGQIELLTIGFAIYHVSMESSLYLGLVK